MLPKPNNMPTQFKCPICKLPVEEPQQQSSKMLFPFCSERCKLIDLGRWLDGKYQIPAQADIEEENSESLPRFDVLFEPDEE